MAHDRPAEGFASRQVGQAARLGERLDPDGGVVAPVVAVRPLPRRNAARRHGAVERARELLCPRPEGLAPGKHRHGLEQAQVGLSLHPIGKRDQRLRAHHAVGVEHDHRVVAPAPGLDEITQVSGLAPGILRAAPVPDDHLSGQRLAQRGEAGGLCHPRIGVAGVREDEDLEPAGLPRRPQRLAHGEQGCRGGGGILLVDRHGEHNATRPPWGRDYTPRRKHEPRDGRPGRQRDPEEGEREERPERPAEQPGLVGLDQRQHLVARPERPRGGAAEGDEPREQHPRTSRPPERARRPVEVLDGHCPGAARRGRRLSGRARYRFAYAVHR